MNRKVNLNVLVIVVICSIFRKLNFFPTERLWIAFCLFVLQMANSYISVIFFFCKFEYIHNYLDFFRRQVCRFFDHRGDIKKEKKIEFFSSWLPKRLFGTVSKFPRLPISPNLNVKQISKWATPPPKCNFGIHWGFPSIRNRIIIFSF